MPLVQYILRPLSGFHLGSGRDDDPGDLEDLPRSDRLVSAVLSVWHKVEPQASESVIEAMAADPPFVLSSAMPTLERGGNPEVLLFVPPGVAERISAEPAQAKRFRRARFASAAALCALLRREPLGPDAVLVSDRGELLTPETHRRFAANPEVPEVWHNHLWTRGSRPRLSIDRLTGRGSEGILFRYASTIFRRDVLLTVVAEFRKPACRPTLEIALRLLGEEGIGGGRSIGHGRFRIEQTVEGFEPGLGTGARMLLSLTHPSRAELDSQILDPPAVYTLVSRGGWAELEGAGALRRKAVNMLAEGSVVHDLDAARYGQSVCVMEAGRMPHAVYRSGCAVTIPISWSDA